MERDGCTLVSYQERGFGLHLYDFLERPGVSRCALHAGNMEGLTMTDNPLTITCPKCRAAADVNCVERGRPWGLRFIDNVHPERTEKAREKLDAIEQGPDCCS